MKVPITLRIDLTVGSRYDEDAFVEELKFQAEHGLMEQLLHLPKDIHIDGTAEVGTPIK